MMTLSSIIITLDMAPYSTKGKARGLVLAWAQPAKSAESSVRRLLAIPETLGILLSEI